MAANWVCNYAKEVGFVKRWNLLILIFSPAKEVEGIH